MSHAFPSSILLSNRQLFSSERSLGVHLRTLMFEMACMSTRLSMCFVPRGSAHRVGMWGFCSLLGAVILTWLLSLSQWLHKYCLDAMGAHVLSSW